MAYERDVSGFDLLLAIPLVIFTFLAAGGSAAAQSSAIGADLQGTLLDETGAVLPGVVVTISSPESGSTREALTDDRGRFRAPVMPVGRYRLRAELSGFQVELLDDVTLTVGSTVHLTMTLKISPVFDQTTVSAAATSPIGGQHTAVATVVSQRQIDTLPINGRNFISFATLTPGVSADRTPVQGAAATSGLVFAGQRPRSNNITVDGLDNNDVTVGGVRATFSQEAIREFQVLTHAFDAEFGKAAGGVLNIVTKSGTNDHTGSGFLYFADKALNAPGYFERYTPAGEPVALERGPYRRMQFGGTFGGPLRRDRAHVFVSFERLEVDTANPVTIDDTAGVSNPVDGSPLGTPVTILRRAGFPVETGQVPFAVRATQFLARLDHHLTQSQHLTVRVNVARTLDENVEPWGGLVAKSRGAELRARDYAVAGTHVAVGSRRFVHEARVQYALRDQVVNALDPTCPLPCTAEAQGGPTLVVAGVASVGRQLYTPGPRRAARLQGIDTVTYSTARHQVKSGIDVSFIDTAARLPLAVGGQFVFAALPAIPGVSTVPISAIQALALGVPAAYFQSYGNSDASYAYADLSFFAQDEWALTPRLTLKWGARYQRQFWPELTFQVPGIGGYRFPRDRNDMAPRVAVAWRPMDGSPFLFRTAYGVFYDNNVTTIAGNTRALNGTTGLRAIVSALPSPIPIEAWRSPGRRATAPPDAAPSLVIAVDPRLRTPYAHHVSAGVDFDGGTAISLAANVVFTRGFNFLGALDYNPLVAQLGAGRRPQDIGGQAGTSASVSQYTSYGRTWYSGLLLSASTRRDDYDVLVSYTLSKAEDNVSDYIGGPEHNGLGRNAADPHGLPVGFDPVAERGASVHDQRHRLVVSGRVGLPGSVHVSVITRVESGRPYDLLAGADFNGDGVLTDRPRGIPESAPLDFSTSAGRNSGRMPAEATLDLRIQKQLPLAGGASLAVHLDVFNLLNRANFTQVNRTFGRGAYPKEPLSTFGQFTEAGPPRQVQLAARVGF